MAAGSIGEAVGVSASNVSFHLKELERGGLVTARRESRSIVYTAAYEALRGLLRFLMEDCCAGNPADLRSGGFRAKRSKSPAEIEP